MPIVARIALVSPSRSHQIETILLRMAQMGQLKGRIGEEQLIDLLKQVNCFVSIKVNFVRRIVHHSNDAPFHLG